MKESGRQEALIVIDQTDARIATVALPAELDCVGGNCELPAGRVKADTDFVVFSAFPARHLKYAREGDIREGGGQGGARQGDARWACSV